MSTLPTKQFMSLSSKKSGPPSGGPLDKTTTPSSSSTNQMDAKLEECMAYIQENLDPSQIPQLIQMLSSEGEEPMDEETGDEEDSGGPPKKLKKFSTEGME